MAWSDDAGAYWSRRILATGGPADFLRNDDSLPAAFGDPQARFDEFGNLYLVYISSDLLQWGVTSGNNAPNKLNDTNRRWTPGMWAGMDIRVYVPGQAQPETRRITGNEATELTVDEAWPANFNVNTPGTRYVITPAGGFQASRKSVVIAYSTDSGATFKFLKILDSGSSDRLDYPTVATGPGGMAGEKSVWVAWRAANLNILATGACVTGLGTIGAFIPVQTVIGSNGMNFPRAQVGPNGQVMVSFHTVRNPNNPPAQTHMFVNVDEDGLGPNGFRAQANFVGSTNISSAGPGTATIPAQPNRGITPQLNLAWDRSGRFSAAPHGRVYAVYTGSVLGFNHPDTDIYLRYSDDSGLTWSTVRLVNTDADPNSQFLPSIAVDQTTGFVAVVWLDARILGNEFVQLVGAVSEDGGTVFQEQTVISAGASNAHDASSLLRGGSTGNNTQTTLNDTSQTWGTGINSNYWRNFIVTIDSGPIAGGPLADRSRRIGLSTDTQLQLFPGLQWPAVPGAGVQYHLGTFFDLNTLYTFDYGEYTGVAFVNGVFYPVWADNSNSTLDNPNRAFSALDIYTAAVSVGEIVIVQGSAGTSGIGTSTVRLGNRSFTSVPNDRLLEALLLLQAQRRFGTQVPSGALLDQFVRDVRRQIEIVNNLRLARPSSSAVLVWGTSQPRRVPSLQEVDAFFRAAWADGILNAADLTRRLG